MTHKVLVITRNLPPLVGGMERLVWHMVDALFQHFDVRVIGPKGFKRHFSAKVTGIEVPIGSLPLFLWVTKIAALWQAFRFRPHIVLAGSGLTAPMAWIAARICGARCVVYLHGLDIETDHPLYRLIWKPFIRRFDQVIVNSHFTRGLAINAGVPERCIIVLNPGVTLPDLSQAETLRNGFRKKYILDEKPVMLYIGRITARKGLSHFVERIFSEVIKTHPDAHLVVIGDEASQAVLKQSSEKENVLKLLNALDLKDHASFLGRCSDATLSAAYFAADVHIFPVIEKSNDPEGFGIVALEAAAHGLPTVGFATGGVPDAVKQGVSGYLVPAGNNNGFAGAVIQILSSRLESPMRDGCRRFALNFDWTLFGDRIHKRILEGTINRS